MTELTTTSHAILGLLARRDWTTYELAQQMHRRLDFAWPRAERKLYEEPRRLVEAGFATSVKDMIGRRARTIYSITPEGRAELDRWLGTPIEPPTFEFEGMVRILFSDQGNLDDLRASLRRIDDHATAGRVRFALMADSFSAQDRGANTGAGKSKPTSGASSNTPGPESRLVERQHLDALAIRFMLGHYENMSEWARWALAETGDWRDTISPSRTWASSAQDVFAAAAASVEARPAAS